MADATGARVWNNTDAYEAFMGRWSRPVAGAALAWLGFAPGLAWLDVGCGTGALTRTILDTCAPRAILGIDPSAEFLGTAAGHLTDPRVGFAVGDAGALPVPDAAHDAVVAGLVLHFVPDPRAAVREMARAARPGGTVAAYVWDFAGERQFTGYLWRAAAALDPAAAAQDPGGRCAVCHRDPLAALFAGAGLRAVTVRAVAVPIVFRDFGDFWRPHLLDGSSPAQRYVASRGDGQRAALRERVQTMLPIAGDGSIAVLGRVWAVRGTK